MLDYIVTLLSISILSGTMGSFAFWNRRLFFNHILAHALLLPMAIGIYLNADRDWEMLIITIVFGVAFAFLCTKIEEWFTNVDAGADILLSLILTSIAFILTHQNNSWNRLMGYVVGDILLVSHLDALLICLCSVICAGYLLAFWPRILLASFNQYIATTTFSSVGMVLQIGTALQAIAVIMQTRVVGSMLVSGTSVLPAILADRRNDLEKIVRMLLEVETLTGDELIDLLEGRELRSQKKHLAEGLKFGKIASGAEFVSKTENNDECNG
jgi:zinc transport system permease protein